MSYSNYASFSEVGQPEQVLHVPSKPIVEPNTGELRVRMLFSPINPADINFVQGVYGVKPQLPDSPAGLEGVGIVELSADPDFAIGDHVVLLRGIGAWAESLTAPSSQFLKIRPDAPLQQAAMLKVNPLTAYLALTEFVTLKPGDWIVQNAANSGVGRCVIQLAKAMGVRTINVVRRPDLLRDELLALGADIVVGEEDESMVKSVLAQLDGARPVLASNCVGGESALRLMDMLAASGTMVTFGAMSKKSIKVPNGWLIFKDITLKGLWCTKWLERASRADIERVYAQLLDAMSEGALVQAVDEIYELTDVADACAHAQQEYRSGKILLRLSSQ